MLKKGILAFALLLVLVACTVGNYDTGDGTYSYLKAEMVDMHTVAANQVGSAQTDGGETLTFNPPYLCSWATTPDSTYRAMLYYNAFQNNAKPVSALNVYVLWPSRNAKVVAVDPVKMESMWLSENKKYINVRLGVLTGKSDDANAKHNIGVVQQKVVFNDQGQRKVYLQFSHNQNQIPEYYTTILYVSIPVSLYLPGDSISLSVNTYNGMVEQSFGL